MELNSLLICKKCSCEKITLNLLHLRTNTNCQRVMLSTTMCCNCRRDERVVDERLGVNGGVAVSNDIRLYLGLC